MNAKSAHSELYAQFARIGRAMANPHRLELLELLGQGEKTVEALARQTGLTLKNTSAHLRELRSASLVATRRHGPHVYYRLAEAAVCDLLRALQELARRRLADVDRVVRDYFEARDALEPLTTAELVERMRRGRVTLLDVRPEDEYHAGHIPGAICIPLDELERRIAEIPRRREVIAYCRGPYCVLAGEALELLRRRGLRARRLAGGVPDWRRLGQPVAQSSPPPHPSP